MVSGKYSWKEDIEGEKCLFSLPSSYDWPNDNADFNWQVKSNYQFDCLLFGIHLQ